MQQKPSGDGAAISLPQPPAASGVVYSRAPYPAAFTSLLDVDDSSHCRYLWCPTLKKGAWQAIGRREHGRPVTTLTQFKTQVLSRDVFITPNQFFDWRNIRQLSKLHANWLEIDTRDHAVLTADDEAEILAQALGQIEATGLPAPTGYVLSGSGGVHFYWIYTGIEALYRRVSMWRAMADRLIGALAGGRLWHVDPGPSRDPARVLRLPGSYHGKTGRLVHAWIGGPVYEFNALAQQLGIENTVPELAPASSPRERAPDILVPESPITPRPKPTPASGEPPRRHTIAQWWGKVFFHVLNHARKNGVREGQRDNAMFILYVALKHLKKDEAEAFARIEEINEDVIHLPREELQGYLTTARKRHYKYRKETLRMFLAGALGMDTDFLDGDAIAPLPPEEVKRRQRLAGELTAKNRKDSTLERLQAALASMADASIHATQRALAAAANVSERTVRRYWQTLMPDGVKRCPSIYAPSG